MSKRNDGKEYELLIQTIFHEILNQESMKNIRVEHDVTIEGKSGTSHQIDVLWEFEIGGLRYLTIVQAKDWTRPVEQLHIFALKGILDDIPNQPKGIIITKTGFQDGLIRFANFHGIDLFELNKFEPPPVEMPAASFAQFHANWDEEQFEVVVYPVAYRNIQYKFNKSWINKKVKTVGAKIVNDCLIKIPLWEDLLFNFRFEQIDKVGEFLVNKMKEVQDEAKIYLIKNSPFEKKLEITFLSPTYYATESKFLKFIRLEGIDFNVEITKNEIFKTPFKKPGISTFILKNVLKDQENKINLLEADTI